MATDGSVSKDGRFITFTSKDKDQIDNFLKALDIKVKIGKTISGQTGRPAYRVQFGDVLFSKFLFEIGITSNKSKTISVVKINKEYFFDFLRGCFDGDGSISSYYDKRWKRSFMVYTSFSSASINFLSWVRSEVELRLGIKGHVTHAKGVSWYQLKYAKKDSAILLRKLYRRKGLLCLRRKQLKVEEILSIVGSAGIK